MPVSPERRAWQSVLGAAVVEQAELTTKLFLLSPLICSSRLPVHFMRLRAMGRKKRKELQEVIKEREAGWTEGGKDKGRIRVQM